MMWTASCKKKSVSLTAQMLNGLVQQLLICEIFDRRNRSAIQREIRRGYESERLKSPSSWIKGLIMIVIIHNV